MLIIPSIDLFGGRAVRLIQGNFEAPIDYGDPEEWAARWMEAGASLIHVVDLDGARDGTPKHLALVGRLASKGCRIQAGGGVRTLETVQFLVEAGVERVVVGTQAIEDETMLRRAVALHGQHIVVAIDVKAGNVATRGWARTSSQTPSELAKRLINSGVGRFLVTDVSRDGTLTAPNAELLRTVIEAADRPVIASGGVSTLEHIHALKQVGAEAAIIGRALYEGSLDLAQAVAAGAG